jgi:hypothetical protein
MYAKKDLERAGSYQWYDGKRNVNFADGSKLKRFHGTDATNATAKHCFHT